MNMLLDFAKERIPIKEFPIETIYINDNEESHFDTVKDSIRIYSQILKFASSSLVSFCIDFLLYSLSFSLSGKLAFSNAFARLISLHCNFFMNKNYVFKDTFENTGIKKASFSGHSENVEYGENTIEKEHVERDIARFAHDTRYELEKRENLKEYLSYLGLALSLFAINTLLLSAIAEVLGINAYLSKILTEVLLFILSYFVQKHLIFSKKENMSTHKENVAPHKETMPSRNKNIPLHNKNTSLRSECQA